MRDYISTGAAARWTVSISGAYFLKNWGVFRSVMGIMKELQKCLIARGSMDLAWLVYSKKKVKNWFDQSIGTHLGKRSCMVEYFLIYKTKVKQEPMAVSWCKTNSRNKVQIFNIE